MREGAAVLRRWLIRATWRSNRKYNPPLLWSKGYGWHCDFKGPDAYGLEETESCRPESFFNKYYAGAEGLLWVRLSTQSRDGVTCDLDNFVKGALPAIRKPFILITTDGDASVPSDIAKDTVKMLLDCPRMLCWYTQNYDGCAHPKIFPIPIGLDLHTPRFCNSPAGIAADLKRIRLHRLPPDQLPLKVFCDFRQSAYSGERQRVITALEHCRHVDFLSKRVSQASVWRRYAGYPFVISAPGGGLDSHRTWEILYLGSIVITRRSSLDALYEGLPVVLVDDWKEVCIRENLSGWVQKYSKLTDMDFVWNRLEPANYIRSIRQSLKNFRPA